MNETRDSKMSIVMMAVADLKPASRNPRTHSPQQVKKVARSIKRFGFNNPVLVTKDGEIIAGHCRVEAAKLLGLTHVPTVRLHHLSKESVRAYLIADNRLAEHAGWDRDLLKIELQELMQLDLNFEIDEIGFSMAEIDLLLQETASQSSSDDENLPALDPFITSIPGDLWILGQHRLYYGSALDASAYERLLQGDKAAMVFCDPPYNVPIKGHVTRLERTKHREFVMASGEMSKLEYISFLADVFRHVAQHSKNGSIHYHCMDWRHFFEALSAGKAVYGNLLNLCVWNKSNAGMGSLYRSKHELVLVFKSGTAPHTNNVELGKHGRSRTNVWDYPGVNGFRRGREEDLATHPTVKPIALVADAILDTTQRKDIVLDVFAGSGTTLIAAERTGRCARLIEIDPHYCDAIVRRWQNETGKKAIHAESGRPFDEIAAEKTAISLAARQRALPQLQQAGAV